MWLSVAALEQDQKPAIVSLNQVPLSSKASIQKVQCTECSYVEDTVQLLFA